MQTFRQFVENKFINIAKKQLNIPKRLWFGMPLMISHAKIGNYNVVQPTMFYVKDFNRDSVTISNLQDPLQQDSDDEIGIDNNSIEATIDINDFYKLLTPDAPPSDQMPML